MNGQIAVTAVVLAAGGSRRLGRPKQLVTIGGEPLVRRVARVAGEVASGVCVVLGARAGEVAAALDGMPVRTVINERWEEGVGSSIACGALAVREGDSLLLTTCDQPHLSTAHLAALLAAHAASGGVVASRYAGTIGVPAIFPPALRGALAALGGDRGAKALIAAHHAAAIDWPEGEWDIDTEADLARLGEGS
jgi:CTP:molybdopterin cytidylyltransferase MocA